MHINIYDKVYSQYAHQHVLEHKSTLYIRVTLYWGYLIVLW
jgi:hypothetical protein